MSDLGAVRSNRARRLPLPACLLALILGGGGTAAVADAPSEGLSLRLDSDLMPPLGQAPVDRDRLVGASDVPVLRSRIYKVRDQVEVLEQLQKERAARLTDREDLIQRMREVVSAQEQVIATLKSEIGKPRPAVSVSAPASARPAVMSVPRAADEAPPLRFGPVELPAAARSYLTEGGLAVVILILLGWALYLRSSANAKASELVVLRRHSARQTTTAPEPGGEPEPAPVVEKPVPPAEPKPRPPAAARQRPPAAKQTMAAPEPAPQKTDSDTAPDIDATAVFRQPAEPESSEAKKTPREKAGKRPEGPPPLTLDIEADDDTVDFVIGEERQVEAAEKESDNVGSPKKARESRPMRDKDESDAPPLFLELESDDETIDFLTEVFDDEDEDEENKKPRR